MSGIARRAEALLELNRPGDALDLLGHALASAPEDPDLTASRSSPRGSSPG